MKTEAKLAGLDKDVEPDEKCRVWRQRSSNDGASDEIQDAQKREWLARCGCAD